MIHFDDVDVRYGHGPLILGGVSFELTPGSFHFLTGESGVGKSSLLRMMYLALRPAKGRVEILHQDVGSVSRRDRADIRRRIGVVFQDFRLIAHLTALENVALPLRITGTREAAIRRHVPELLAWVGLKDHLDALPHTLSGGQQQRVAIARAVIARPALLLADEPTGNIDDHAAQRLFSLFGELHRTGTTVVVATHDNGLVANYAHPRLNIADGGLRLITGRPGP